MGCNQSGPKNDQGNKKRKLNQLKATILVFGLPDAGQAAFVDQMQKQFVTTTFSQTTYAFVPVNTSRAARENWPDEYENNENVIASFFFCDISSPGSVLLSIKTYNWLISQLVDKPAPYLVAKNKTMLDNTNFTDLKKSMSDGVEIYQYADPTQQEFQKLADIITNEMNKFTANLNQK